jgi:hypothetical protein
MLALSVRKNFKRASSSTPQTGEDLPGGSTARGCFFQEKHGYEGFDAPPRGCGLHPKEAPKKLGMAIDVLGRQKTKKPRFTRENGAFGVSFEMPWEALRLIFGEASFP